ncbi:MAG TPA: hypothetical protein VFE52_11985, partial [Devosia sp.]|nr:hypothetical protein [Devosia sp.]
MPDPADKSDDLIAELAKLMASSPPGGQPAAAPGPSGSPEQPVATPAPAAPPASAAAPTIRIPGMDQPRPIPSSAPAPVASNAAPANNAPAANAAPSAPAQPTPAPAAAPRAPVTGAIRIPGMDNPAPVATSAPVSRFDFGAKPQAAAPIKQEPLSTFSERLAPQNPAARVEPNMGPTPAPQPAPTPIRIPSDLKPISENRSFGQGPALPVAGPSAPAQPSAPETPVASAPEAETAPAPASDFSFDFGFGTNPPKSSTPPRPTEAAEHDDPIADLIASSMNEANEPSDGDETPEPRANVPVPVPRAAIPRADKPAPSPAPVRAGNQPIPLKAVTVAPRNPEADRFSSAPNVGLNMKAAPSQPAAPAQRALPPAPVAPVHSDPMSEIESLIGDAVRVELAAPGPVKVQSAPAQKVAPQVELEPSMDVDDDGVPDTASAEPSPPPSAPVVPPLNTQFAPRRAGLKDEIGQTSAEDAILAAVAATGAPVDHVEPKLDEESPYRRLKVRPKRSNWGSARQYVGMAVAATLLLAAGLGLYWVLNMGRGDT